MGETISLTIDGFRYGYRKCGVGTVRTPIFFVSGAFQSMKSWRKFERYFNRRQIPVILADLPGTGDADVLPEEYDIEFLAEATAQVIQHAGIEQVHLVSASYGSPIAYRCAERNPSRISSLICGGIMKEIPSHVRPAILKNLRTLASGDMHRFATEGIEGGFLSRDPSKKIDRRDFSERVLYQSMSAMTDHTKHQYQANTRRLLRQQSLDLQTTHSIRSLFFTGEFDTFTRPDYCREVAKNVRRSWFTTIRRADHLFHIQRFQTTAQLVERFISGMPLVSDDINEIEYVGQNAPATCVH